jgi:hypothetical protein
MHCGFHQEPHWEISYLTSSRYFLTSLPELVGSSTVLYLESYESREEWMPYLTKHRASSLVVEAVTLASAQKPTWIEHISLTDRFIEEAEKIYLEWYSPMADHIHCYRDGKLLFWFHDAFTGGPLQISREIPEEKISNFCRALAPRHKMV